MSFTRLTHSRNLNATSGKRELTEMLICICGEDFKNTKGNMKTAFQTWNLLLDAQNGRKIYANYRLYFERIISNLNGNKPRYISSFHELLSILTNMEDVSMGLDELSVYFDCYSGVSKKAGTWYLKNFGRQTRKRTVKLYYTAQSFGDVHRSMRIITDKIYVLRKLHPNMDECTDEFCYGEHLLEVTEVKTGAYNVYQVPTWLFQIYNSDEIIEFDEIKCE